MATMRVSIDTREVRQLSVDLSRAPGRAQRRAPQAMRKNIRALYRAMKRDATGHRYLSGGRGGRPLQALMAWEQTDALGLVYEVGFDKESTGKLAHIIVFGSVNNAPVYEFHGPLVTQTPKLLNDLGAMAENAVLGGDVQ